jgi:hypothetical protein
MLGEADRLVLEPWIDRTLSLFLNLGADATHSCNVSFAITYLALTTSPRTHLLKLTNPYANC